jgi:hypothetical protein
LPLAAALFLFGACDGISRIRYRNASLIRFTLTKHEDDM